MSATLAVILLSTLVAGIGSVWLAALLSFGVLARHGPNLLSLAAGALLATAFMHLVPEAVNSEASAHDLFAVLLGGIVFFFLLDKAELWHHGHEHHHAPVAAATPAHDHHHGPGHAHDHDHDHAHPAPRGAGGWAVLAGDSVHCFGDGVLIASAFVADWRLGLLAALSVMAHEVPHHMGDLVVLRQAGGSRRAAIVKVSLAGAVTALGGAAGYALVALLRDWLPFFLVLASSSFVYVALADLIPQLQRRLTVPQTVAQVTWLLAGIGLVTVVSAWAHAHH